MLLERDKRALRSEERRRRDKQQLRQYFQHSLKQIRESDSHPKSKIKEDNYVFEKHALEKAIDTASFQTGERGQLYKILSEYAFDYINTHNLKGVEPPSEPWTIKCPSSNRTEESFQNARILGEWQDCFEAKIETMFAPTWRAKSEIWLGLALWSIIAKSHIGEIDLIMAIYAKLISPDFKFCHGVNNKLAIKLSLPIDGKRTAHKNNVGNVYRGEEIMREHVYHPDPLTLAIVSQWLMTRSDNDRLIPRPTQKTVFSLLAKTVRPKGSHFFKSLKDLLQHSYWLADDKTPPGLSEAVLTVCSGRWTSIGLDSASVEIVSGRRSLQTEYTSPLTDAKTDVFSGINIAIVRPVDWSVFIALQELFAESRKTLKMQRPYFKKSLEALLSIATPHSAQWALLKWYLSLIERGLAISTVRTYHSKIACRLIEAFQNTQLNELSGEDFEDFYHSTIHSEVKMSIASGVAEILSYFHKFAAESSDLRYPRLPSPLPYLNGPRIVRSRIIPAEGLNALLHCVKSQFRGNKTPFAWSVCMAIILAARGGLRLSELMKLRIQDVEISNEIVISIVPNEYGRNKSAAGRRKIALGHFLSEQENEFVKKYFHRKQGAKPSDRFLALSHANDLYTPQWLSRTVSNFMKDIMDDMGWTFHHLRHTAANNLFLALNECPSLTQGITGWSAAQQNDIVISLIYNKDRKQERLLALSSYLGHASPEQSFLSYVHMVEPLVCEQNWRRDNIQTDLLATTFGLDPKKVKIITRGGGLSNFIKKRLVDYTEDSVKFRLQDIPRPDSTIRPVDAPDHFEDCIKALRLVEQGQTLEEVTSELGIHPAFIYSWVESARNLKPNRISKSLLTRKGKSRLFSPERLRAEENGTATAMELLLPKPLVGAEILDIGLSSSFLIELHKKDPELLKWITNYFITHVNTHNSGLIFNNPDDARRFMNVFGGSHIGKERWYLEIIDMPIEDCDKWQSLEELVIRVTQRFSHRQYADKRGRRMSTPGPKPGGSAYLHLNHFKFDKSMVGADIDLLQEFRSAQTFRFVFHVFAIILRAESVDGLEPVESDEFF